MKHLFSLLIMISAFINVGISQSSILSDDNYFVQEKIGENFNQVSAIEGDVRVLFHKDRIELISEVDGEERFFFIKLNNVSFNMPEGEGMVNREIVPIEHADMAMILKSSTIEKSYFKSISYTDINSGKTLVISMKGNRIDFNGLGDTPLELQLWGNGGEVTSKSKKIQLEEFGKVIELSSDNCDLTQENNKISFKQNGGNDNANLQLSISIF